MRHGADGQHLHLLAATAIAAGRARAVPTPRHSAAPVAVRLGRHAIHPLALVLVPSVLSCPLLLPLALDLQHVELAQPEGVRLHVPGILLLRVVSLVHQPFALPPLPWSARHSSWRVGLRGVDCRSCATSASAPFARYGSRGGGSGSGQQEQYGGVRCALFGSHVAHKGAYAGRHRPAGRRRGRVHTRHRVRLPAQLSTAAQQRSTTTATGACAQRVDGSDKRVEVWDVGVLW